MKIEDIIRALPSDAADSLLSVMDVALGLMGKASLWPEHVPHRASNPVSSRHLLETAAGMLLEMAPEDRLRTISDILDSSSAWLQSELWIRKGANNQLVGMIDENESVRFSFAPALRPCITYAFQASRGARQPKIQFCSLQEYAHKLIRTIAIILDLEDAIDFEQTLPWDYRSRERFDLEFAFPPFGSAISEYDEHSNQIIYALGIDQSRRGRLSHETVAIANALASTNGRSIICVTDGELFRMVGAEPVVRRTLVESGRLTDVLAIPPSLMFSSTLIKTNLVVIGSKGTNSDQVRFIDLGNQELAQRGARGRMDVRSDADWNEQVKASAIQKPGQARNVDRGEIAASNFILTPERYLNTGPRDRISAFLAKSEVALLAEVVEMVRPINLASNEIGKYIVREAAPSDVDLQRGYIREPNRVLQVDPATYNKAFSQQLRPGDLVLSIKGTIGIVGIVPDHVPQEAERTIWTAGQSLMILRPKKRGGMSRVVLYEYLTNDTVQSFLRSLAAGSTIMNLAMKDLKDFPVPILDAESTQAIEASFAAREAVFNHIAELDQQIKVMRAQSWPHNQLGPEET